MPVATQAKLLRVLEDRKLRRLGSKIESPVDVRVLAATNKNPDDAVADGHLRGDLFYRLNVFNIHMPPLRDHKEDIPAIVDSMLRDMNQKHDRQVAGVNEDMMTRLIAFDWPGNVRELRNTIERAVVLCSEGYLDVRHLPPGFGTRPIKHAVDHDTNLVQVEVGTTVDEAERRLIVEDRPRSRRITTRPRLPKFSASVLKRCTISSKSTAAQASRMRQRNSRLHELYT